MKDEKRREGFESFGKKRKGTNVGKAGELFWMVNKSKQFIG
jgi:hypothetical protein